MGITNDDSEKTKQTIMMTNDEKETDKREREITRYISPLLLPPSRLLVDRYISTTHDS
jgi:hypothetical protein